MVSVSFSSSHCNLLNFTFFMFPFVVKNKTKNFLPEHLNNHSDNTENKLLLSVFSFRIHSRAFKLWFHNNLSSLQKDNKHYDYLTRDTPETLTLYICMMFLNKLTEALKWCGAHHAVSPSSHRFHLCSVNQKEEEEEEKKNSFLPLSSIFVTTTSHSREQYFLWNIPDKEPLVTTTVLTNAAHEATWPLLNRTGLSLYTWVKLCLLGRLFANIVQLELLLLSVFMNVVLDSDVKATMIASWLVTALRMMDVTFSKRLLCLRFGLGR